MQPAPLPNSETSVAIANRRAFANDLLTGKVDLRAYPHRYLIVCAYRHVGGLPSLFVAVDWLEAQLWELVNVFEAESLGHCALMRRRHPQSH